MAGIGGWKVAASRCVDGVRGECYDGWVWGVWGEVLFVREEAAGEGLLEVGNSGEGGYVGVVKVGEAHIGGGGGWWFVLSWRSWWLLMLVYLHCM